MLGKSKYSIDQSKIGIDDFRRWGQHHNTHSKSYLVDPAKGNARVYSGARRLTTGKEVNYFAAINKGDPVQ